MTAAGFLFHHAAFAAFVILIMGKAPTGKFIHAKMKMNGSANGSAEIKKCQYEYNKPFYEQAQS